MRAACPHRGRWRRHCNEMTSPARNKAPSLGARIVAVGGLRYTDRDRCRERRVHTVRDREPRGVLARLRVRVARVRRSRRAAVPERPGVRERLTLRIGRAALEKLTAGGAGPAVGVAHPTAIGAWFSLEKRIRRILLTPKVPLVSSSEIDVVQRSRAPLEVDDVAVGAVGGAVDRFEVEDAVDVSARVDRLRLDPVLCIVGEEIAALVAILGNCVPW